MKVAILLLFLVGYTLGALTTEQRAKIEPISKKCREQTGLDEATVKEMRRSGEFHDEPKIREHVLCISKETGSMTETGDINWETIKARLKKVNTSDEVITEIENCAKKHDTAIETAWELYKCIRSKQPNYGPAD